MCVEFRTNARAYTKRDRAAPRKLSKFRRDYGKYTKFDEKGPRALRKQKGICTV